MSPRTDTEHERRVLIACGIFVSIVGAACIVAAVIVLYGPIGS